MHNGYGSGDVTIRMGALGVGASLDGFAEVTVPQDAIYRRLDAQREEWIIDVDGTSIDIRLEVRPGTSQADLDDAHAIIDSIRLERRDNDRGFIVVFTITNDDWDSG